MEQNELKELIQKLSDAHKEDPKAVIAAMPTGQGTLYHEVFSAGHADATGRAKTKLDEVERDRDGFKAQLETANQKVAQLEEKAPDVQRINREWQEKYDRDTESLKSQLTAKDEELVQGAKDRALDEYERKLIAQQVDPAYARVSRADVADRIKVEGKGKERRVVVTEKGKEIPIQATGDKTPVDVLVEEVLPSINPKFINENVDTKGSNTQRGNGPGPSRTNEYEAARKRKEDEQKAKQSNRMNLREIAGRA